jgi:hypothetical protein
MPVFTTANARVEFSSYMEKEEENMERKFVVTNEIHTGKIDTMKLTHIHKGGL